MKKMLLWMTLAAVITAGLLFACGGAAAAEDEPAEWTVMFYFCGSDLESRYSYASDNLAEMLRILPLTSIRANTENGGEGLVYTVQQTEAVHILVETGGAREWHAQPAGMDVSAGALQRWHLRYCPTDSDQTSAGGEFELMETLPLRNMGDADTLSDYIRWCVQNYPAKKYALVLWGHGNGGGTGLLIDELFDNDILYLTELNQALKDGGTYLEALVIDACLMANIETAWAVRDSARWMAASEETVPGRGSAFNRWLQALVRHPAMDGRWLCRCVCDTTDVKYADMEDAASRSLLTWSVIDLSKIERLAAAFDRFFREVGGELLREPSIAQMYAQQISSVDNFGDERQRMLDIGNLVNDAFVACFMDSAVLDEMLAALTDAVDYAVRGDGRTSACGLSFCYLAGASDGELDAYAEQCPSPAFLAYLDATASWTAPEWVFERTERLPDISTIEEIRFPVMRVMSDDGLPALLMGGMDLSLMGINYRMYRLDEETGQIVLLGKTNCTVKLNSDMQMLEVPNDPMSWPSIEGVPCCMELVRYSGLQRLYNIPVQINTDPAMLRCVRTVTSYGDGTTPLLSEYEIAGVWEGFETNGILLSRGVQPLALHAKRSMRMMYPVDNPDNDGPVTYAFGPEMTVYRQMDMAEALLPPGTYYMEFEIQDVFLRTMRLERIELYWDGEQITYPDGFVWEGEVEQVWNQ